MPASDALKAVAAVMRAVLVKAAMAVTPRRVGHRVICPLVGADEPLAQRSRRGYQGINSRSGASAKPTASAIKDAARISFKARLKSPPPSSAGQSGSPI